MRESELLAKALDAIHRESGIELQVLHTPSFANKYQLDATLAVVDTEKKFYAEIKKIKVATNWGALLHQLRQVPNAAERLLIADYINPKLGEKLKQERVQYIDAAGNAFICSPPIYVSIQGNRKDADTIPEQQEGGRAFKPIGLKVIFAFINDRELINAPYRKIAAQTNVALGNIGWILKDLINQGFVEESSKSDTKRILRTRALINKWAEEYPLKLRPKLILGKYTTENRNWHENIDLDKCGAQWGGELAASKLTNYLSPEKYVVYIEKENLNIFLRAAKLRKAALNRQEEMEILVIEKFWKDREEDSRRDIVPPALIYADLIETGNTRNLDVAERIFEQYIN